ncbi:peptide ABC transporter permease [Cytobacillus firmus]|uniref:ABC transporter permease n=1 Tax=Cytobacillus firmus TaxID=1399 RepID=UPI00077C6869|nr:ABC transporter permease [Cytobacillus firmus]MBG9541259.1 peptide ABC transporter permease [Cytobacillus firmus]MBG9553520.1 peptide ABC transporter permease [Cytobacillus firmus]MBG9556693.1 peptide ABC transporter permease [Cytobacillus firmus]MBG9574776.1 peptide ABC transporter permease [Cytobacillus firmus]MED4770656.1 ABC transporter permease [Cytobacillus firmus]
MGKFITGKLLQYFIVIFLMLTLNFLLPRLMPGNPLVFLAGEDVGFMSSAEKDAILDKYGLNDSILEQYGTYIKNIFTGDFGYSYQQKRPISELLMERLPWTMLLTGLGLVLSTVIGVMFGAISAWRRGTNTDANLLTVFMFLSAMPSFWVGMILVSIFSAQLGWLPVFGAESAWSNYTGMDRFFDIGKHLILPLATLILISVTSTFMIMRYSMLNVLGEDYIMMAKAKGVKEKVIKYKHAMRNALLPVATVFMLSLGFTLGGATVIETVFAYPGVGRLMFESVLSRDYPLIQATFLIITFSVVIANFLADLIYPLLDPKVGSRNG